MNGIDEQDEEAGRKRVRRGSEGDEPADEPVGDGASDDEEIEILEVSAADDAGVRIPEPEMDVDVEMDDEPDPGPRRSQGRTAPSAEEDALRAQVSELREQVLRTAADFENFRKRVERERIEERKQAAAGLVRGIVPVLDSFRRALAQAEGVKDNSALDGFVQGVRLIEAQLFDILRNAGLEPVDAEGRFDPSHHEALMQEPSDSAPHLSILEVFEPGYRLGGRLLRPARVKVAHNPGADAAEGDGGDSGSGSDG